MRLAAVAAILKLQRVCRGALAISVIGLTGATAQAAGDFELGRYLASECMTCHRSATAASTIPNIFGMAAPVFTDILRAYRAKQLPNPVMQNIAARLSDEEIASLALYFSRTKKP
jgi:cytochrome c